MSITMNISSDTLDKEDIQRLTEEILVSLHDQNIKAEFPSLPSTSGSKGDPATIGTIVLSIIGPGGVALALIKILQTYVTRKDSIEITMEKKEGRKLIIKADNLSKDNLGQTTKLVKEFFNE